MPKTRAATRIAVIVASISKSDASALADRFHVVSPDYPGFGNSDIPCKVLMKQIARNVTMEGIGALRDSR
jgi:pimeloyl-ACP methyl ester carboxylesterase